MGDPFILESWCCGPFLLEAFLGSMLPQYSALSILFVCVCVQKNLCVRSLGYIVAAFPPLCVSVHLVTLWVRLPLYG